ncbi:small secreted hydrophilic protein [Streptomyces sp. NPDC088387]|uniref:small secreted hydrophilic protein n=1 Tax=Streptomyces sp. NPDC088387 TaxID=3365859 RepID=UPI0038149D61
MVFSHRMAALAAVVVIPLGIAATSYALTDHQESPKVPAKVELDSGTPSPRTGSPTPAPSDEVVPPPPATDAPPAPTTGPSSEDDDDDRGEGTGGDDDGPDDSGGTRGGDDG